MGIAAGFVRPRIASLTAALAAALATAGCQENLSSPGDCPALCPGNQIVVRDTVIEAIPGADSAYFGYLPRSSRTILLVSDGIPAGEYRSFAAFPAPRTDSISVDGTMRAFAVDTIAIQFTVQTRDTLAKGLKLYLHRLPLTIDTTADFPTLSAAIAGSPVFDSILVPDTLKAGLVTTLVFGDRLAELATAPDDSGRVALGLTLKASKPTGVRLAADAAGSAAAPVIEYRGRAEITDTAKQRQKVATRPDGLQKFGFVGNRDLGATPNPDLLYIGGLTGARTLVRFDIPDFIRDSSQILRATLQLTPAFPLDGLPNSATADSVAVRGIQTDLGAKSPPLTVAGLLLAGGLKEGTRNAVSVDLFQLVAQWQVKGGPPPAVFIAHSEEALGGGFMQPVFYSTRSAVGRPTLRLTYGLPSRPGKP